MGGSSGPASAGGDYMVQYAGMDMGGSSGSASETIRWKLSRFYGWLPTAQLIWWELYFVSSGCLRPALNKHPLGVVLGGSLAASPATANECHGPWCHH